MLTAIIISEPLNISQIAFGGNNFFYFQKLLIIWLNSYAFLLIMHGYTNKSLFMKAGGGAILSVNGFKYLFSKNLVVPTKS